MVMTLRSFLLGRLGRATNVEIMVAGKHTQKLTVTLGWLQEEEGVHKEAVAN